MFAKSTFSQNLSNFVALVDESSCKKHSLWGEVVADFCHVVVLGLVKVPVVGHHDSVRVVLAAEVEGFRGGEAAWRNLARGAQGFRLFNSLDKFPVDPCVQVGVCGGWRSTESFQTRNPKCFTFGASLSFGLTLLRSKCDINRN